MPNSIIAISAPVAIQAASNGDKKSPATFTSTFYTGGALELGGWNLPVVVDLAGLTNGNVLVANLDHDASKRVGNFSVQNDGKTLVAHGAATASTAARDEVVNSAKDGYQWQASLEVTPKQVDEIKAGERVEVNGQSFVGPLYVTRAGVLKGFAFVSHGADDNTTATIAARANMQPEIKAWAREMGLDVDTLSANQLATIEANYHGLSAPAVTHSKKEFHMDGTNISAEARRAFLSADRQRQDGINAACGAYVGENLKDQVEALRTRAIESDMSVADVKAALFDLSSREARIAAQWDNAPQGFGVVGSSISARSTPDVLTASLLCRTGRDELAVKTYGEQTVNAAKRLRAGSLVDLCQAACTMQGVDVNGMNRNEMIRAAFSTISLQTALSNATGKALWQAYMEAPSSWRRFAKVLPAANFKAQVGVRPSFVGSMEKVGPAGEIKHGQVAESTYNWSISTFAKQLRVTRQDVINDDLGFFDQTAPNMARMAARNVSDLVWTTILANGSSFFHADHANYLSGGSSPLDATSLALAIQKMRQQRDAQSNDLDIMPVTLVVPLELEQTGKSLLNSEYIQKLASDSGPTGNSLKSSLSLEVEARISNTAKFTNATATQWYLFASPADAPVVVGFLDGQQNPQVEFFGLTSEIDTLGVAWRIYHDVGCSLADYRAAVKSAGA